ncbi:NAD-dependent DNA ligase [Ralstonia phage phiRSL1]|uniref:DNA ligase (NAD(+)) n=1 Tax=Ralstonia phage phiRSL1 TaxID=1980924 RepID=B2ZXT5_9CAUD|nr:NAD-dependent DNA ligase [Ralstonia phage phiRSL1]BAG41511.1 NAD-dependent DNA ligase [Ralstonia phage phiRSL1]
MKVTAQNLNKAKKLYKQARVAYYEKAEIMTDAEFDALEDSIRRLDPKWDELQKTGTKVEVKNKKQEVKLLEFMPSKNKIYPEHVAKYAAKHASVEVWNVSHKLDGTSLQLAYRGGRPWKLITRGDGALGKDISFFLPHLVKIGMIPDHIKTDALVVVFRCEGIMPVAVFEKKWAGKYDNARQLANGVFNRQDMHPALADVHMVVLSVYGMKQGEGIMYAKRQGFHVVPTRMLKGRLDAEVLTRLLNKEREASIYEMDGLILVPSPRIMSYTSPDRPKDITAFKFNDEENAAEVPVESVVWQKTRLHRWQPKITIKPTFMDGVMVTNVTAHNPAWMKERGIGPGAIVKVLRSGGVIPKIVGVVKKGKFQPPPGPYVEDGRLFRMTEGDASTEVRGIHHFMTTLGIELLASKTITKLYEEGFTTVYDYIDLAINGDEGRLQTAGIGVKMSQKIQAELERVLGSTINLRLLMVASGCFRDGIGRRKLEALEAAGISMRFLLKSSDFALRGELSKVKGFSDITIEAVIDGVNAFRKWFDEVRELLEVDGSLPKAKKVVTGKLTGQFVSWTGYRNKDEEQKVEAWGGTIVPFGSKTTILLYSPSGKTSSKVEKAGSKAMTWVQLTSKFKI